MMVHENLFLMKLCYFVRNITLKSNIWMTFIKNHGEHVEVKKRRQIYIDFELKILIQ